MKEEDERDLAHFKRRCDEAKAGRHLPTLKELLRGAPFMHGSLEIDAQIFAERVLPKVDRNARGGRALAKALVQLTVGATKDDFLEASKAFVRTLEFGGLKCPAPETCAARCLVYAAAAGCRESALRIAGEAIAFAYDRWSSNYETVEFARRAWGWLLYGAPVAPSVVRRVGRPGDFGYPKGEAEGLGDRMAERFDRARTSIEKQGEGDDDEGPKSPYFGARDYVDVPHGSARQPLSGEPSPPPDDAGGIVVFKGIGNADTREGRQTKSEFSNVLNKVLALVPVPDLEAVKRQLLSEFPHAEAVADAFVESLATHTHVKLPPAVLVGSPGSGKTTFAARLLQLLGVPCETFSCGGVSDSALAGTARRWSTGEPSLPVALVKRHLIASPGIVLDEIEKVGTSRRNGNLLDALLGLLEPQSAAKWHDPYLEAAVDLTHVVWLATANSLEGLQAPLRDRCRVIQFPDPAPEHVEVLASRLLVKAYASRGLDQRWVRPLDDDELDAIRNFWRGGSLRRLARLIEGVVSARERDRVLH